MWKKNYFAHVCVCIKEGIKEVDVARKPMTNI